MRLRCVLSQYTDYCGNIFKTAEHMLPQRGSYAVIELWRRVEKDWLTATCRIGPTSKNGERGGWQIDVDRLVRRRRFPVRQTKTADIDAET